MVKQINPELSTQQVVTQPKHKNEFALHNSVLAVSSITLKSLLT